jgi:hypothetical protein
MRDAKRHVHTTEMIAGADAEEPVIAEHGRRKLPLQGAR